ncbi:MAG: carbohydrate ABC transporter permease [Spirochaetia bacterium]
MNGVKIKNKIGRILLYVAAVLIVFFLIGPFIWVFITSLQRSDQLMTVPPQVSIKNFNLRYYKQLFSDSNFRLALKNSLVIITLSSLFAMAIASLGGYAVGSFRMKRKGLLLFSVLAVQLTPALALLIPLFMIFNTYQLVDTYAGLVFAFLTFQVPVAIWILRGFFNSIPRELFDSSRIDGCSRFGTFFRIALPLARPGIVAVGIFTFIQGWNDLLIPLVLSVFERTMLTVYAASFGGLYDTNYGGAAAVAMLSALPTIILAIIFRKQLISGLTAGAVKG